MKNINVLVKKWFDKINGNTYHSVTFEFNNKVFHQGLTYGYGSQYKVTLRDMLIKNNLLTKKATNYNDIIKNKFNYIVMDVNTEEELEKIDYFNQI